MKDEKRRFLRFPFKMKAELATPGKVYDVTRISNLSIGGCLLPVGDELKPGTRCTLRIKLSIKGEEPNVSVEGVVMRNDGEEVAIKFTKIDPDSLVHLQNIARYNSTDPDRVEREIHERPGII